MDRQQAFKRLKKPCVEILEAVAGLQQRPAAKKKLVDALVQLLRTLNESNAQALDAKFAEFVFVPISRVLAVSGSVPVRALELCLDCIFILLKTGWKADLTPQLSGQLLILFTFLANPSSAENGIPVTSDELQAGALKCMGVLLDALALTTQGKQSLTSTSNIPTLGKAVLVIVDNIADSTASDVRLQAVVTLQKLASAIDDADALASFFPRMVSSLTKALTPSTTIRINYRILVIGLDTLSLLLRRVVGDAQTKSLPTSTNSNEAQDGDKVLRTTSWLQATAAQIKIALATVFKLRNHDKREVQEALLRFCLTVIQDCRRSLGSSISMSIETAIHLAGRDKGRAAIEKELTVLLSSDLHLSSLLRESLHGWIVSLPRVMQSKDDSSRRQIIKSIAVTLRMLGGNNIDLGDTDYLLAGNLRDGVVTIVNDPRAMESLIAPDTTSTESNLDVMELQSLAFQPIKLRLKGQDDMLKEFGFLLHEVASSSSAAQVAKDLVAFVSSNSEEIQFASFWLAVNLVKDLTTYNGAVDAFLDLGVSSDGSDTLDELYSVSLERLSDLHNESSSQWHIQALALETIAMQAQKYGSDFRVELNDALYPVLHLLGSSNLALRHHAVTCLNIMAAACGYQNASKLVVSNVDYIVNAVGMQLNSHDISPQAPQVLLMMLRLCGPSLLPFLDDLVSSIFSALETYHGYPKLVELLFAALKGMAEEGVRTPQLVLTEKGERLHANVSASETTIDDVTRLLETMEKTTDQLEQAEDPREGENAAFPKMPWKNDHEEAESEQSDSSSHISENPKDPPDPPPPAPRTFDILLRISELTQHYLTSASPTLRTSLLSILHTTIPALAKHENSFLPLINTLWPVLLPRLEDSEAYVVSTALDIAAVMCEYAGNFMKSRIEDVWEDLKKIYRRAMKRSGEMRGDHTSASASLNIIRTGHEITKSPSGSELAHNYLYVDAPSRMIWESLVALLCKLSEHVAVRDEFYTDILDMLDPILGQLEIQKALQNRNPNAIWLREHRKSHIRVIQQHISTGRPDSTQTPAFKVPIGEGRWDFVSLQVH